MITRPGSRAGRTILALGLYAGISACGALDERDAPGDPELLHSAMDQLTDVIVYDIFSPPQASRAYTYASVAAFEAARHDRTEYISLAGQLNGLTTVPSPTPGAEYSFPLAGVHAFLTVGKALTFSPLRVDSIRAAFVEEFRRRGVPDAVRERSVAYGEQVAAHILAWSREDGFLERLGLPKFTVTPDDGRWVPTPPGYMDAVEPNWATLRPFVLDSASQFRPPPPPPFDTAASSAFFREVLDVYQTTRQLTDEQRETAHFWNNNPYTMNVQGHTMFATKQVTPGGHWMGIAAVASRKAGADLVSSAEAYARTAAAVADGFIVCWEEKYRSNLVRPETVINTYVDETWQPLLQTPPFPEYTSGHSVISAAAATVLSDQFGADFEFEDDTQTGFGMAPRTYPSFEAAADEAALSRLYGGIHYRAAINVGRVQGRGVGELVVQRVRPRPGAVATRPVVGSPRNEPASAADSSH
ncbi:MAG TPA: vanadium-dependent haloperoxidase [Gemmatimonadaceae bacterium]|nr:vanadium-dependent haloperoxidase [Gemmatimonadaceae bacterium]